MLLLPLSWLYGLVSGAIRLLYRLGIKRAWRAPVPVVVVGNLTAGGNGKTPVVIRLVEQLQKRGIRPGVVSRGYGGEAAQYPLVLSPATTTAEAGDEPVLIYQRTGAPVAVSPVRSDAVKALLADFLKDAKLDDSGAVKGLAAEIDTLAKADATAFLFNTTDGNAQQFKGMQPGAAGGKTPPAAGKEPKDMNYDELCAYLEANPGAKLE